MKREVGMSTRKESIDRRTVLSAGVLLPFGLGALSACGGGGGSGGSSGGTSNAALSEAPRFSATQSVSTRILPLQQADVSTVVANPGAYPAVYNAIATDGSPDDAVRTALGSNFTSLTSEGCAAVYATLFAFNVAPAGSNSVPPLSATLKQLLNSQWLACGHYCKLATMLSSLMHSILLPPDAPSGSPPKPTIHFLVWEEDAPLDVGVHSQLVVANVLSDAYLLLDPLFGLALRIPFTAGYPNPGSTVIENAADLLSQPIDSSNLVVLDSISVQDSAEVQSALLGGQLSASYIYHDALYGSEGWDTRISGIFASAS